MRRTWPAFGLMLAACFAPDAATRPAVAAEAESQSHREAGMIIVTGHGEASGRPDMARIEIGVSEMRPSAGEALAAASETAGAVQAALRQAGIPEADVQTRALSVNAEYDYSADRRPPRLTGYTAANTVTVRLKDLDKAGAAIDAAFRGGATQMNGFQLDFSDPEGLLAAARRKAIEDARAKAALYAETAGVRLGPVLRIQDLDAPFAAPEADRMMAGAALRQAPIAAGESVISAGVAMSFAIES